MASVFLNREDLQDAPAWPLRPLPALGIGLLLVPLVKQFWILLYVFNFLHTLVHELGHTVFAWLMGMPALPKISLGGDGGVTSSLAQIRPLCFAILAGLGWFAWQARSDRRWLVGLLAGMVVYAAFAFTSAAQDLRIAGGVLFELGGATACFYWVLTAPSSLGAERPLYSLWGWWMLLNRLTETWLMLRSTAYWDAHTISDSGITEGLVNDIPALTEAMNITPTIVLSIVLVLGLSILPLAVLMWQLKRRRDAKTPVT